MPAPMLAICCRCIAELSLPTLITNSFWCLAAAFIAASIEGWKLVIGLMQSLGLPSVASTMIGGSGTTIGIGRLPVG